MMDHRPALQGPSTGGGTSVDNVFDKCSNKFYLSSERELSVTNFFSNEASHPLAFKKDSEARLLKSESWPSSGTLDKSLNLSVA